MRYISLTQAKEGDIVALPVYDEHGRIFINSGVSLTTKSIDRLREKGIFQVSVEDAISEGIDVSDDINLKIKPKCIKELKNFNLDKALESANKIAETVMNHPDVFEYFNEKTFDNYTYEHSISVSVYASMVGLAFGFNPEEIKKLAIAGILHDIGKKCIPYEILHKPDRLNDEEFNEIKKHPNYGYNMVKENTQLPATAKVVILQHHENEDGSGYPKGLKGDEIYKFSKIVHIVDVYDALISRRPYKDPMDPKEAMDFIIEKSGGMFDEKFVDAFIQIMPSYPKGKVVVLNDGRKAIVLKNIKGNIHRPHIRILDSMEVIKLSEEHPELEIIGLSKEDN